MQTDHNVLPNINIIDGRQKAADAKKVEVEKPKEQTPADKKLWAESREKLHNRMFPNAKKDDGEKKADNTEKPAKPEAKNGKATVEKKELADGGDGTEGDTDKAKVGETEAKPKLTPKKEVATPPVDYDKLVTTATTAAVKAVTESKAKEAAKVEDDVPEARRRDLAAIKYLDQNNPKYKGKAQDYKKFAHAEADYVSKWEKDNPGRKFNSESDEHEDWYDKHEPDIDPEDITDARVELAAERRAKTIVEKETGATKQEVEKLRLERDIERAERVLPSYVTRNFSMVASALGDDVAQAMSKLKNGETLEESDPAAHTALMQVLPDLQKQTTAAARIFGTDGRAYDAKDQSHIEVFHAAQELESLLLAQPEEKLSDAEGRTYAKLNDWAQMNDAQRAKHWTIGAELMSLHLGNKAAQKAGENYKTERGKVEKMANAYGYVKNGAPATAHTAPVHETDENESGNSKPRSPSTSTRTVIQPGAKVSEQTSKDGGDAMLNKWFRR